jgi:hypothetical protein
LPNDLQISMTDGERGSIFDRKRSRSRGIIQLSMSPASLETPTRSRSTGGRSLSVCASTANTRELPQLFLTSQVFPTIRN